VNPVSTVVDSKTNVERGRKVSNHPLLRFDKTLFVVLNWLFTIQGVKVVGASFAG